MEVMTTRVWSEWINEKYQEYLDKSNGRGSMLGYAKLFDAPHQVVRSWMRKGSNPPHKPEYIQRLIDLYGFEAFEALGIKPPENLTASSSNETRAIELLREVPVDRQKEVLDLIEYLLKHGFRRTR